MNLFDESLEFCHGCLRAARRIGELVPAEQGKRTDKEPVRTSDKLSISKQRLSEFRKLAEIPMI